MNYFLCIIYLLFSVSGLIFMKLGSNQSLNYFTIPFIQFRITWISAIGYACYIISFLFYTIIISKFELSVIVPVLGGLVNVIVLLAAFFIFKETLNSTKIVGVILVCIGIIFINLKK